MGHKAAFVERTGGSEVEENGCERLSALATTEFNEIIQCKHIPIVVNAFALWWLPA